MAKYQHGYSFQTDVPLTDEQGEELELIMERAVERFSNKHVEDWIGMRDSYYNQPPRID